MIEIFMSSFDPSSYSILLRKSIAGPQVMRSSSTQSSAPTAGNESVKRYTSLRDGFDRYHVNKIMQAKRCVNCTSWQDGREE